MNDTTPPEAATTLAFERCANAIRRGARLACTRSRGGVTCLGRAVAWCRTCDAPRCERDSAGALCVVCGSEVVAFSAIRIAAPHGLLDHGDRDGRCAEDRFWEREEIVAVRSHEAECPCDEGRESAQPAALDRGGA